ncbi:MAG: VWA domain-containing protein [Lachnospiraceae bacterium]|nr:VWA domain-containing protein [Lachnospiraceae bacterium]
MRKGKKKLVGWMCLMLVLALLYPMQISGAKPLEISVENIRAEGGKLFIYANTSVERKKCVLAPENFQITLGGTEVPCEEAVYFSDTDEAVAYIYLVDISGSIHKDKLQKMKDFLKAQAGTLREQDRACLITFGDSLSEGEFTGDKEELVKQIDGISSSGEDTNLYHGMVEALKILNSAEQKASRRALIVLSDGEDDQAAGITREEVAGCLEEIRIPVYTAAMLDENPSKEQQKFAKILGSFARQSAGGMHTAFGVENISIEEGAARIKESIGNGMILQGDLSKCRLGNGQAYLQVTLDVENLGRASDGYMAAEHELGLKEETEKETQTESQTQKEMETAASETEVNQEKGKEVLIWVMLAIAVTAAAGGVAAMAIGRRRRNKEEERTGAKSSEDERNLSGQEADAKEKPEAETAAEEEMEKAAGEFGEEKEAVVYLTKIGLAEETTYEIRIRGEALLGRESQKADYAFPEDGHMSGVHCVLAYFDGKLILQDQGSKNGTWVNGVPVTQPYVLNCDDIIHMGKTDFRIHWRELS